MAINIGLISTGIVIAGSIVSGVYFAEDRYAHTDELKSTEISLKTTDIDLQTTKKALPETYTLAQDFHIYRLESESRWVQSDIETANSRLELLIDNKDNLTHNQRRMAKRLEQRLGRLLKRQQTVDTSLQQIRIGK